MFKLLPTVPETSETWESLSSERKPEESKKSTLATAETSTVSVLQSQKDLDLKIWYLKHKVRNVEMKNTKVLRNAENLKKKQDELNSIKKEFQDFRLEKKALKDEELIDLQIKKQVLKVVKETRKQKILQCKENLLKKNKENQALVLKERLENQKFIQRREKFYIQQAREKSSESGRHERARSVASSAKDPKLQETLLVQMKTQQVLIEKLENALKAEENLRDLLSKSKEIQNLSQTAVGRSRSCLKKINL